jgi:tetratricopeptide (TPR) repeat protein
MIDWLRPLLKIFYAPGQALGEVRERSAFGVSILVAVLAYTLYELFIRMLGAGGPRASRLALPIETLIGAGLSVLFIILVFIPAIIFFTNLVDRRGSFRIVLQQEYIPVASVECYALAAAAITSIPFAWLLNISGIQNRFVAQGMSQIEELRKHMPEVASTQITPELISNGLFGFLILSVFGAWTVVAVREVFRFNWIWSIFTLFGSVVIFTFISYLILSLGSLFLSPFLLLLFFFLLRGYFSEISRTQNEKAAFKKHLEIATINPADASAHYNLGLWYQKHNRLDEAEKHFKKTVEIDPEEIDAHYQLGRIKRAQNQLEDAIKHFEEVVRRDQGHAQFEIWREVGATYLAAKQYGDARDTLEQFLTHRPVDPEGLYLMGCAQAGLGLRREAEESMRACIEAVEASPAYKYRADKRWLREARQFLRS